VLRQEELIARVGGDEFIIVQKGGSQPRDAGMAAERIIKALEEPFVIFGATVTIGASVGIAIFPRDASSATELTKKADAALYRAKEGGGGAAQFYNASIGAILQQRQTVALALAGAIREQQFRLFYQPILSVRTGSIECLEALLRWQHPELGDVDPALFIGIAEERALIHDIGMWALKQACRDAAGWYQPVTVAVNFSPVQFLRPGLAKRVAAVLKETRLDPHRLEIEVTENVLLSKPDQALKIFRELKGLGVRISLDDFGTGYSSLSYFREFPFDKVKIDRSFVADLDGFSSKEIVRSVLELSRSLGIAVVAEGVETTVQLNTLRELGCELVQGYLVSRPQPVDKFEAVLFHRPKRARAA
jgi:predicted signal transduction protein with EAL and GGDEF domain